jgi:hypothetical protein
MSILSLHRACSCVSLRYSREQRERQKNELTKGYRSNLTQAAKDYTLPPAPQTPNPEPRTPNPEPCLPNYASPSPN